MCNRNRVAGVCLLCAQYKRLRRDASNGTLLVGYRCASRVSRSMSTKEEKVLAHMLQQLDQAIAQNDTGKVKLLQDAIETYIKWNPMLKKSKVHAGRPEHNQVHPESVCEKVPQLTCTTYRMILLVACCFVLVFATGLALAPPADDKDWAGPAKDSVVVFSNTGKKTHASEMLWNTVNYAVVNACDSVKRLDGFVPSSIMTGVDTMARGTCDRAREHAQARAHAHAHALKKSDWKHNLQQAVQGSFMLFLTLAPNLWVQLHLAPR